MASGIRVSINADFSEACRAVAQDFASFGEKALPRAAQFSANGVAIDAVNRFRRRMPELVHMPVPWIMKAISYEIDKATLNTIADIGQVRSSIYVLPQQSATLEYLFGNPDNMRTPGDVGAAEDKIFIPFWNNIALFGIRPDSMGNLKRGEIGKLKERVRLGRKGRVASRHEGFYEGPIKVFVQRRQALIARPSRVKDFKNPGNAGFQAGGKTRLVPRMADVDVHRILFLEVDHADYKPVLQDAWELSAQEAVATFPKRLDDELGDKIFHARQKRRAA